MKSAKFTEAQRKEEKTGEFDSVGQLVYFAEKIGGKIPRHDIETTKDIIDEKIENLKRYQRQLISQDTALAQQIENYIRLHESAEEREKELQEVRAKGFDNIENSNEDYIEYSNFIENGKIEDTQTVQETLEEGDDNNK